MKYIFIPGVLCDKRLWDLQIEALKNNGVPEEDLLIADVTQDDSLSGMAKRLLKSVSGSFNIISFSLGTQVAFEVMKRSPERVNKLLLASAVCGGFTPDQVAAFKAAAISADKDFDKYLEVMFPKYLAKNGLNYDKTKNTFMAMAKSLGQSVCINQVRALSNSTAKKLT